MELFPYCWIESGSPLLSWWLSGNESACSTGDVFWSLGRKDPLEKEMATHSSIFALENPHGQRSLVGYNPWGHKESDMTEQLSTSQG